MIQVLELFGGIGAPRKALMRLGIPFKSIDYVEIDEKAVRSYNAMFKHKYRPQSVIGYNLKPDVLVHGSPCQDFSRSGKRLGGKDEDKTRSSLMHETLKIVENFGIWKPKVIIWENVKGVLDHDMIQGFQQYLQKLEDLGYTNSYQVVNAMDYGIPQKRERLITISRLDGKQFDFTMLQKTPTKNISEYLEGKVDDIYTIKIPSMLSKIKEFSPEPVNRNYNRFLDVIEEHCWTISTRQDRCPNAGIIKLSSGNYRYLTELECWRLMGFDDEDYFAVLSEHPTRKGCRNATLYKQAGNSIVVQVLEAIFAVIIEELKEETV